MRLASRTLVEHADARSERAHARYAKRAAFRATPHGLWAGVALAELSKGASALALGEPLADLTVSWERLAALGSALLSTDAGWRAARFRRAPSLLRDAGRATWISYGEEAEARRYEVELDELLRTVLDASEEWIEADALCRRLRPRIDDAENARALVLELVEDGLLHHDLEPPLIGPPPLVWACERLVTLCPSLAALAAQLGDRTRPATERVRDAEHTLRAMPGTTDGVEARALHATLLHTSRAPLRIERAPVERAAALAPLLFRLAEALVPPVAEAALAPGLEELLRSAGALVGEGMYELPALELGRYGGTTGPTPDPAQASMPIVAALVEAVVEAARARHEEITLDPAWLHAQLPALRTPSSFELQLTPCTDGARAGDGWLLGVHAPAGASWGRFAAALGAPGLAALLALREAERVIDGDAVRVDVSYAPTRALADLCTAPAVRDAALAVSSWPEEGALLPAACAIANDPVSAAHRGISAAGHAIIVAPLHRVRSTTAPASVHRALLADTLHRQHAPWAMSWGPLARLSWLPRVRLGGFVIAPQSWALPPALDEEVLVAWRRAVSAPQTIQVGDEDALLPIDLERAEDRATLFALPEPERRRAYEIWPPLGTELEQSGRRVELSCAVVDPDADRGRNARLAELALAPPPGEVLAPGWRTIKLYAPRDRHARLLTDEIAAFVAKPGVRAWFFLPYVDPPGAREHLRLRIKASDDKTAGRLAEGFRSALEPAIRRGELAAVEVGGYHPEHARYGAALAAAERIFQSDSELIVSLAAGTDELPDVALYVAGIDALAAGLGLSLDARAARAADALRAYAVSEARTREELAPGYRALQAPLAALLARPPAPFRAHRARVRAARMPRALGERLLPTLAHLAAVRLFGPDRDWELRGLYLWQRALEGQRARKARAAPKPARSRRPKSR